VPHAQIGEVLKNLDRVKAMESKASAAVRGGSKNVEDVTPLTPENRIRWV